MLRLLGKIENYNWWGVLIPIFSILSLFGGGGFFIGMILGIIDGALGLAWKPKEAA